MEKSNAKFKNVDHYISSCPTDVQPVLQQLRDTIKNAAPNAIEKISYGMPFYEYGGKGYKGRLIYFAAFKKHISLFIPPEHAGALPRALQKYHVSKATYQFPLNKPFPYTLLEKTVKQLVKARDARSKNSNNIPADILSYHNKLNKTDKSICDTLYKEIQKGLPDAENKIWHGHPVWFLDGNPIVGYSKQKQGIRLMFWSGASFEEERLNVVGKKFKDASVFYHDVKEINTRDLKRWLKKSRNIQWDYKNIVKRKGILERLK
ncbi:MAG: hypothetical protein KatS3mg032_1994 [Cyclobacteriaceae bacterium]|nr:MAG: hypothetical protein KatS3mg032_1994 [Cyclobacteriaceae bacterium]